MSKADVIQVIIAGATLVAAIAAWRAASAAWRAASAARDTAREAGTARRAERHNVQITMLVELIGLVAGLIGQANLVTEQGQRYVTGARISSLVMMIGYELPNCDLIGKILGGDNPDVAGSLVVHAEKEVREALAAERNTLAVLTGESQLTKPRRVRWLLPNRKASRHSVASHPKVS